MSAHLFMRLLKSGSRLLITALSWVSISFICSFNAVVHATTLILIGLAFYELFRTSASFNGHIMLILDCRIWGTTALFSFALITLLSITMIMRPCLSSGGMRNFFLLFPPERQGFMNAGGSKPNLADLAVFGVLRPIRHLQTGEDMIAFTHIGQWYSNMEEAVGPSSRLRDEPLLTTLDKPMNV